MKKLIYIIIGLVSFSITSLKAQDISEPQKMWTSPSVYAMDEPVTWYFDFSNATEFTNREELFLWIWAPVNPTNAPIPLTFVGDKVWSITFTPTTFFKMTVQQLFDNKENFYFLIRDATAAKKTVTLMLPKVNQIAEFVTSGKVMSYAPADFQLGSTLSILFNSNLVTGFNTVNSTVHLHSGLNDWSKLQEFQAWLAPIRDKTQFKDMGNGIYKKDLVPKTYYGVDNEFEMSNITFLMVKYNGNDADPGWAANTAEFKILAPGVPVPPDPKLFFFPQKISIKDILVITRDNNLRGQSLSYSVKGGAKTISGNFKGGMARQRVFVNVAKEFKGMDISQLHVLIKDQGARVVYEDDMPLVKVDNAIK